MRQHDDSRTELFSTAPSRVTSSPPERMAVLVGLEPWVAEEIAATTGTYILKLVENGEFVLTDEGIAFSQALDLATASGAVHSTSWDVESADPGNMTGTASKELHGKATKSEYAELVVSHLSDVAWVVIGHPDFGESRDDLLAALRSLQNRLLDIETEDETSLAEQMTMIQADLRGFHKLAPRWLFNRVRAMFSDQAFAASMGAAIGAALTKFLA